MTSPVPARVAVLWCADWPVTAAQLEIGSDLERPIALVEKGRVVACSSAARTESVRRGLRIREAQARCSSLVVIASDGSRDARAFEPLVLGLEELTPGIAVLRPGLCAVHIRGAARYYGGERAAAQALVARLRERGGGEVRAGVADGLFAAEQAARRASDAVSIIPEGSSAHFLSALDLGVLDDASDETITGIITLLRRLGMRTLGDLACLSPADVRQRFGLLGARLHDLASGTDRWPVIPRTAPDDLEEIIDFEPPLEIVDQIAFGVRASASQFVDALTTRRLVATAVHVQLETDRGDRHEREWRHPRSFTPSDLVDRVRWQAASSALTAPIARVTMTPAAVDALSHHEPGLWGSGPDERVHHGLSRVQSLLGHDAVLVPMLSGGRTLEDRQQFVAWGDRPIRARSRQEPWPGALPDPLPGTVYVPRRPVLVLDHRDQPVSVDEREALSSPPVRMVIGTWSGSIVAWAGPWPLDERWWDPSGARRLSRWQMVDGTGCAWLLVLAAGQWSAEARYD